MDLRNLLLCRRVDARERLAALALLPLVVYKDLGGWGEEEEYCEIRWQVYLKLQVIGWTDGGWDIDKTTTADKEYPCSSDGNLSIDEDSVTYVNLNVNICHTRSQRVVTISHDLERILFLGVNCAVLGKWILFLWRLPAYYYITLKLHTYTSVEDLRAGDRRRQGGHASHLREGQGFTG